MVGMEGLVTFVRVGLVLVNTLGFAGMALWSWLRARELGEGPGLMSRTASVAFAAVAVGGIQRLGLQAAAVGILPDDSWRPIVEYQALAQSVVVFGLGLAAVRWSRQAERRLAVADDLLRAFGDVLPEVEWDQVRLTPREEDVLTEICGGALRDAELANRLGVSNETVRSHVKALLRKTSLQSRMELAVAGHLRLQDRVMS